jgi:multisubunit Na+/H+ antiporter MnhB subunit
MTLGSFITLVVIAVVVVLAFLLIASIPGQKARERGHPQAEAINILGWVGLLLGVAPWLVALIWAYSNPPTVSVMNPDSNG